jgi:hypothetical protein
MKGQFIDVLDGRLELLAERDRPWHNAFMN